MQAVILFLKIVFVTKGIHSVVKGAESAARDWYLRIREQVEAKRLTDEPTIVERSIRKGPLSSLVAANPATLVSYAISMSRNLKRICNKVKPDLVHIHVYSGYNPTCWTAHTHDISWRPIFRIMWSDVSGCNQVPFQIHSTFTELHARTHPFQKTICSRYRYHYFHLVLRKVRRDWGSCHPKPILHSKSPTSIKNERADSRRARNAHWCSNRSDGWPC